MPELDIDPRFLNPQGGNPQGQEEENPSPFDAYVQQDKRKEYQKRMQELLMQTPEGMYETKRRAALGIPQGAPEGTQPGKGRAAQVMLQQILQGIGQGSKFVPLDEKLRKEANQEFQLNQSQLKNFINEDKISQMADVARQKDLTVRKMMEDRNSILAQKNQIAFFHELSKDAEATGKLGVAKEANRLKGLAIDGKIKFQDAIIQMNKMGLASEKTAEYIRTLPPEQQKDAYDWFIKIQGIKDSGETRTTARESVLGVNQEGTPITGWLRSISTKGKRGYENLPTPGVTTPQGGVTPPSLGVTRTLPEGIFKTQEAADRSRMRDDMQDFSDNALQTAIRMYKSGDLKKVTGLPIMSGGLGGGDIAYKIRQGTNSSPSGEQQLRTYTDKAALTQVYALTGKQISQPELQKIKEWWPDTNSHPEVFMQNVLKTNLMLAAYRWKKKMQISKEEKDKIYTADFVEEQANKLFQKLKDKKDLSYEDLNPDFNKLLIGMNQPPKESVKPKFKARAL